VVDLLSFVGRGAVPDQPQGPLAMKSSASRSLLVLELIGLLLFDGVACGMMRWIGNAPVTPLRLLIVGLFLLLLWSSGATVLRAVDYLRDDAEFDVAPRSVTRLVSLAVPVALLVVIGAALFDPAERVAQLTTSTMLLFVAAATPTLHLELVTWARRQPQLRWHQP